MVQIRFASALAAASLVMTAWSQSSSGLPGTEVTNPITTPTVTKAARAMIDIGCFATPMPLENHGPYLYRSPGNCQLVCLSLDKNIMGLSDGENCWCGDKIPAKEWKVDNSTCDTNCSGDKTTKCGGAGKLWISVAGSSLNKPEQLILSSISSSAKSSTATSATSSASSSAATSQAPEESKPNTAGIAAGVVVGIVGLGAILGGVWFFMRRRRQKQAEDDYRRNAANVDSFVSGGKLHTSNSSMNDSRLDPSFIDRRTSNGSIADNEDYSRRILKVTNV